MKIKFDTEPCPEAVKWLKTQPDAAYAANAAAERKAQADWIRKHVECPL